jgi:microcystin-dependent protein
VVRLHEINAGPIDFLSRAWPVGSVFASTADTNPADLLGFGAWEAFAAGRVLVGLDAGQAEFDTLGETGGAKEVTLTAAQMPAHTHLQDSHNHTQQAHSHVETVNTAATGPNVGAAPDASTNTGVASGYSTQPATAVNNPATAVNQSAGGDQSHNNLQPYCVVRFWKRTA